MINRVWIESGNFFHNFCPFRYRTFTCISAIPGFLRHNSSLTNARCISNLIDKIRDKTKSGMILIVSNIITYFSCCDIDHHVYASITSSLNISFVYFIFIHDTIIWAFGWLLQYRRSVFVVALFVPQSAWLTWTVFLSL